MASLDKEGPVTLSVLDRLIDQEPERKLEPPMTRAQSLRELRAALRRDLEWLFNTRSTIDEPPESLREVERSVYNYGVHDTSSLYLRSPKDQDLLSKSIKAAISSYEPRLMAVKVTVEPSTDEVHGIHFNIEGLLRMDPAPEPIFFDTLLEPTSGEYKVKST
ncbi:MAG: type VI secretion system baseplate subunit TssE [Acidobacteriota bacterium]|jgi:type VI secretion system protein ImpF|nr:type VI secretion system baseplate subunit TssE [Acidobacteriota bacterium]